MYIADEFKDWNAQACILTDEGEKWVLARPMPFYGLYGLKLRIKDAWAVLTGKADAVRFIGQ
jgi:hypothetical protein